jgi:phosphoribosylanthranilate isomerase
MKLKVCGLTSAAQLEEAYALGVDYAGLVLYDKSPRSALPFLEKDAAAIKASGIAKVGVFVNEDCDRIFELAEMLDLTAIQLHGDETPAFCEKLRDRVNIIKAFQVEPGMNIDELVKPYNDVCNYFLFDTKSDQRGGSGIQFDWNQLEKALVDKLFFISGGIGPDDMEKFRDFYHPFHYGIDINSRFEISPGVKDMQLVAKFLSDLNAEEPGRMSEAEQTGS